MEGKPIKLPESLPNCQLIDILISKANSRHDIDFNFIGHLDNFHQQIRAIVGQINLLFPEYTPHDDQYHLKNLFHVADTLLGGQELESMNSTELFILACSMYGHDWGMAVSDSEKHYIVTGRSPEGMTNEVSRYLEWDRNSFCTFASKHNLRLDTINKGEDIDFSLWQEYVRQTHAIRSGIRAKQYFESIDTGVAEGIMRVCESHSLNFEELRDPLYPTIFSVLREEVNLRALAVYLRLIDLFDLAHDRTPYVLWKYVMPRNGIASLEWSKHRALQPITCPDYLQGRRIRVDGSTNDHEVWAALEDLRLYCELQLSKSNDVLSRMNDARHKLDLYAVDWRVAVRGFSPISIQFEFDRESMFKILSDEIYQGDCYIFLRELLQNSIDAIRFRRAIIRRSQGFEPTNLGIIQVLVEHEENGDAIVTWKDDGIGMDEYIVKNYFAVEGKSYYRSPDFEREDVKIDPISRFGIGKLSCFMVADSIEVETYKDPYLSPAGNPLRISIPAINRQFRIEVLPPEGFRIGTTVRVYVKGDKIRTHLSDFLILNVTDYISTIAGFVEFPILIEEGKSKTIVLHPCEDTNKTKVRFGKDYQIHQLSFDYSWDEEIVPQDIGIAMRTLSEKKFDLATELGIENCEGKLCYLVPSEGSTDFSGDGLGRDVEIIAHVDPKLIGKRLRWSRTSYSRGTISSRSAMRRKGLALYKDGILVPQGFRSLDRTGWSTDLWVDRTHLSANLWVNIVKSEETKLDLSRTEIIEEKEGWIGKIRKSHTRRVVEDNLKYLLSLEDSERLYQLARLSMFNNLNPEDVFDIFPKESWPIAFLNKDKIKLTTYHNLPSAIFSPPIAMREEIANVVDSHFSKRNDYQGILSEWENDECLALYRIDPLRPKVKSITIGTIRNCYSFLLGSRYMLSYIRFLKPPWNGNPPLLQSVHEEFRIPDCSAKELFTKVIDNPFLLEKGERIVLRREIDKFLARGNVELPIIVTFPSPFSKSYAYGENWLNASNEAVGELLRIVAKIMLGEKLGKLSTIEIHQLMGALVVVLKRKPNQLRHSRKDYDEWVHELRNFGEFVKTLGFAGSGEIRSLIPSFDEFIPGSFDYLDVTFAFAKPTSRFGEVL